MDLLAVSTPPLTIETVLSIFSAGLTGYFWLVKSRQEKPHLSVFQLHAFRKSLRRGDPEKTTKRLGLVQTESGGVLVTNHSTRQNSIVRFDCYLREQDRWIKGNWGYVDEDKPPWNIPPQSSIALSLACFFEVAGDYEHQDKLEFRVEFCTATGHRFAHVFTPDVPET